MYLNPRVGFIPEVTAQLCQGFLNERSSANWKVPGECNLIGERTEGLLLFLGNQSDLSLTLALIGRLQSRWSEPFNGQRGMLLGEEVAVGGKTLQAVRLAQSPGNGKSFNESQLSVWQGAMLEALGRGNPREHYSAQEIQRFIGAIGCQAALNGWNSQRSSFLAAQDMRVIDFAIRNASNYWPDNKQ